MNHLGIVAVAFVWNLMVAFVIIGGSLKLGRGSGGPMITRSDNPIAFWTMTALIGALGAGLAYAALPEAKYLIEHPRELIHGRAAPLKVNGSGF